MENQCMVRNHVSAVLDGHWTGSGCTYEQGFPIVLVNLEAGCV